MSRIPDRESPPARPRPEPRQPTRRPPEPPPEPWLEDDRASLVGRVLERRGMPIEREEWIMDGGVIVGLRLLLSEVKR